MTLDKKDETNEKISPQKQRMIDLKAAKEASTTNSRIDDFNDNKLHVLDDEPNTHDKYSEFRKTETSPNPFDEFTITKPKKKPSKKKVVLSLPLDIVECIDEDTDDELNFKQSHVIEQILRRYYTAIGKLDNNK